MDGDRLRRGLALRARDHGRPARPALAAGRGARSRHQQQIGSLAPDGRPELRLCDRGSGLGGLRGRIAVERGPERHGPGARGRRKGPLAEHQDPGRVREAVPHQARLGPQHGPRAPSGRPRPLRAARQEPRGIELDERDDVGPRAPARLRRLERVRLRGLGLRGRAALLQALRERRAPRRHRDPRRRRTRQRRAAGGASEDHGPLHGGCPEGGDPAQRRHQLARAGRSRDVPREPAQRSPLERRRRLPAPGDEAAERDRRAERDSARRRDRGRSRGWRALARQARGRAPGPGHARGRALGGRDRQPAAADALGHRPGGAPRRVGDRVSGRQRRRRRQPPGSPLLPALLRVDRQRGPRRRREAQGPARVPAAPQRPVDLERGRGDRVHPHPPGPAGGGRAAPLRRRLLPRPRLRHLRRARVLARRRADRAAQPGAAAAALGRSRREARPRRQPPRRARGRRRARRGLPQADRDQPLGAAERGARPPAGPRLRPRERRRDRGLPAKRDRAAVPPGRHLPHGRRRGLGRRPAAARPRGRWPPRGRRLGDAGDHRRQHQRADDHDRREGRRPDQSRRLDGEAAPGPAARRQDPAGGLAPAPAAPLAGSPARQRLGGRARTTASRCSTPGSAARGASRTSRRRWPRPGSA